MGTLPGRIERRMVPAKLVYLLYFGAGAALFPYITLYFESLGFSGRQIGVFAAVTPLVTLFSAALWGGLADASGRRQLLFSVAVGGVLLATAAVAAASTFFSLMAALVFYAFCAAPLVPFIDGAVLGMLEGRREAYGKQRVWGAVGWGIVAPAVGVLTERAGLIWIFYIYMALLVIMLLPARRLPLGRATLGAPFWRGVRLLLGNWRLLIFLVAVLAGGSGFALVNNFLFLHLNALGASNTLMGFSVTLANISELPVLFFSDRLLRRWSPLSLLRMALLLFAVRVFAYSLLQTPQPVLLIQLLHGLTFAAMWAAAVTFMGDVSPPGLGTTAQGLLSSVMFGLGGGLGGLGGGLLYDSLGAVPMFRVAALVLLLAALPLLFMSGASNVTSDGWARL